MTGRVPNGPGILVPGTVRQQNGASNASFEIFDGLGLKLDFGTPRCFGEDGGRHCYKKNFLSFVQTYRGKGIFYAEVQIDPTIFE
jgi:hypothetical protein